MIKEARAAPQSGGRENLRRYQLQRKKRVIRRKSDEEEKSRHIFPFHRWRKLRPQEVKIAARGARL